MRIQYDTNLYTPGFSQIWARCNDQAHPPQTKNETE